MTQLALPIILAACALGAAEDAGLNHRLMPGESLNLEVDASRVLRKDIPEVRGISIHGLTGWMRHPYAVGTAKYHVAEDCSEPDFGSTGSLEMRSSFFVFITVK